MKSNRNPPADQEEAWEKHKRECLARARLVEDLVSRVKGSTSVTGALMQIQEKYGVEIARRVKTSLYPE